MQDGYNYNKPRRRRRRKRINWTAIFFWLVVLMAIIAIIVMLVKPKDQPSVDVPDVPDDSYQEQWQPSATQKPVVTLPIVPETTVPQTDPPATNPPATDPPATNPPATDPPTEPPTEPPTTPPTEATAGVDESIEYSSAGEKAAAVAKSALGMPYEYGGSGPGTFDTSGLIYFCYKESGVEVPRLVSQQAAHGVNVEKSDLLPGDVVFFYFEEVGSPEYVGIYIGNGSFVAARSSAGIIDTMSMNSSYYTEHFVCARRYY